MTQKDQDHITYVSLDLIDEPAHAVRTELDDQSINELADDIKRNGLIEPIILRPVGQRYEVVAGHRRFSALKRTGAVAIASIVRTLTDREALSVKLSENLQRKDINLLDEAAFYAELTLEHDMPADEIGKLIGRTPDYIFSRLRILGYPQCLQNALLLKQIPLGAAEWLAKITDPKELEILVSYAVKDGITVRNAESWVENYFAQKASGAQQVYAEMQPDAIAAAAEPLIVCQKCLSGGRMRELMSVWIHRPGLCRTENVPVPEA